MSEILFNSYYKTGSVADLCVTNGTVRSSNAFPLDLQRSYRLPLASKRSVSFKTTLHGRSLYYLNKQSNLTAFVSSDGDNMFFNNKLAKIFVCCGHVWAIFYRPNGKQLR